MTRAVRGWMVGLGLVACMALTGCGRSESPRWFEYDNAQDQLRGKVNLDNVTYVTPRVRFGTEELRLHRDSIRRIVSALRKGDYTSFRVRASILFDDEEVVLYESALFEKGRNPVTRKDLARIESELKKILRAYERL